MNLIYLISSISAAYGVAILLLSCMSLYPSLKQETGRNQGIEYHFATYVTFGRMTLALNTQDQFLSNTEIQG